MRGPVRVGSHPLNQVVVSSKEGQVQALAPDVGVLVSAESAEIELLVVDQEIICGPPDLRTKKVTSVFRSFFIYTSLSPTGRVYSSMPFFTLITDTLHKITNIKTCLVVRIEDFLP